jgi:cytoskeletal protein CcmA (bactofilin family)
MAMSPFFTKREPIIKPLRSGPGTGSSSNSNLPPAATHPASTETRAVDIPVAMPEPVPQALVAATSAVPTLMAQAEPGRSQLTVGPNIKLKGVEITDCDTLVVEGFVEATMDSRVIQIAEHGAFKGSAEIDIAEIHGQFDGNLTVRQKLTIFATGKVTGNIRYGKLVIEEGGRLGGDIQFGAAPNTPRANSSPALPATATADQRAAA